MDHETREILETIVRDLRKIYCMAELGYYRRCFVQKIRDEIWESLNDTLDKIRKEK